MCFNWFGSATPDQGCNFGPLAVLAPLLQRMEVAQIIDQHLPPDPQAQYSHGHVLRLLLARLTNPVALCNVPQWAQTSGADILWNIPPEKLNDDRLGRPLDAFYYQRHSILAHLALHVAEAFQISLECLHYDPTHVLLHGDYANSQPRVTPAVDLQRPSAHDPPAHITYGHNAKNTKMIQAGVCAAIDDFGAVPLFGHTTDGNHNGHTAIAEQCTLLHEHLPLRKHCSFPIAAPFRPVMSPAVSGKGSRSCAPLLGMTTVPCMRPTIINCTGNGPVISLGNNNAAALVPPPCRWNITSWRCCAIT